MENQEKDQIIASLIESNDNLRDELAQLRNNNRILRRVHSALRSANQALRNQVAIAQQNDELFKELCQPNAYGVEEKNAEQSNGEVSPG
jgi:hypothetical protein